ncbi:uncharacterized protein LOC111615786 [Centruroides sculpturatus]|uniref:uncharacterized protein LOC111615786 n=1 Tax=Centruroides sculpturatus TaxID=218467 RepID=UPI000C6CB962|nr:uncharacterized protein LOC111615786 [Centruroides sculpturatus]
MELKLQFNPSKTKAIIFAQGNTPDLMKRTPVIKMGNRSIKLESEIMYLGVVLDNRMTWLPHVLAIRTKCTNLFNALARVARRNWRLNEEAVITIYEGAFVPKMTYAAAAWSYAAKKGCIIKHLRCAQRMALLRVTKAFRTASTEALMVVSGIPPIDLVLKERTRTFYYRKGLQAHMEDGDTTYQICELRPMSLELPMTYERKSVDIAKEEEEGEYNIFTDGSKLEGRVGSSFVVYENETEICHEKYRLRDCCSVHQAEMFAIMKAVEWVALTRSTNNIVIHTDSRSAIQTLMQFRDISPMALEAKKLVRRYNLNMKFKWVKAHVGIIGNERADALAKEATEMNIISYDKAPITYIKRQLRQETVTEWQDQWTYSEKGRFTFWLLPSIQERLSELAWLPKKYLITQILTNHCSTKHYLKRIGKTNDSMCECGGGEQTLEHLINECLKYEQEQMQLRLFSADIYGMPTLDLYQLIRNSTLLQEIKSLLRKVLY